MCQEGGLWFPEMNQFLRIKNWGRPKKKMSPKNPQISEKHKFQVSEILIILEPVEPRKKPSYFPLYWLFNRDPYNGLL